MNQLVIANIAAYVAAFIGVIMFLPQVIKCLKTKNTKDISSLTFMLVALASLLWVIYGIIMKAPPIYLVNFIVGFLSIFILILKKKYG